MRAFILAWSTVAAFLVAVVAPFAAQWWLIGSDHEFGAADPREWLLARGTVVDRLGLIEPLPGSVRYLAQPRDGNAPRRLIVSFRTAQAAGDVLDSYAAACARARLAVEREDATGLACTGEGAELGVSARREGAETVVILGGWLH